MGTAPLSLYAAGHASAASLPERAAVMPSCLMWVSVGVVLLTG